IGMTKVGFIGLGIMGSPMAVNLQHAGFDVSGFNRSPEKTAALVEAGGRAASSVAAAGTDAGVVAGIGPDSADGEAVLTGDYGVFAHAAAGTIVIDFSSIRPDVTIRMHGIAREKGMRPLDAPVSGGEVGAKNAALSIMVGGEAADFMAARPV